MTEFLAMGGYAVYVWPSFALTFIVMGSIVASTRWQRQRSKAAVLRRQQLDMSVGNQSAGKQPDSKDNVQL